MLLTRMIVLEITYSEDTVDLPDEHEPLASPFLLT